MFNVTFSDGKTLTLSQPVTGEDLLKVHPAQTDVQVVAWHVNHYLRPLDWVVDNDAIVDWVDLRSSEGVGVYQSSLSFVLTIAARRALGRSIIVNNSISEGLFWELEPRHIVSDDKEEEEESISPEDFKLLKNELDDLIAADLPIRSEITSIDRACQYFIAQGRPNKARLLNFAMTELPVELDECAGYKDMFWTPLVPSTGYLKCYALSRLAPGMVLRFPTTNTPKELPPYHPSRKLQKVFLDYADWMKKLHVSNMADVWDAVARDGGSELILVSEALHAQQITAITVDFLSEPDRRVITIAGPSASGKTTTSHKLRIQLQVMEKHPVAISLDDYFVDREKCPLDENGNYDFEAVESLNLDLLESQMGDLLAGKTVRLPKFNFHTGKSMQGNELKLQDNDVLIIEGLHGLNDRILETIPRERRFGIFLSPLTSISLDNHTRTSTTDLRLLRRMLRDFRTRGSSPVDTLLRWPSVVRGGMKYIFPYQKNADAMFNSSLFYELPVMRIYAELLLRGISPDSPVYGEAARLLRLLRDVPPIAPNKVPSNSLLREFIGGSIIEI